MRLNLLFLLFAFSFFGFSQEEQSSIYFPQEQLIHSDCADTEDKNTCLKNIIEKELLSVLQKPLTKKEIKRDTLTIDFVFRLDESGNYNKEGNYTILSDRDISKKYSKAFDKILKRLPESKVLNKKSNKYITKHIFEFSYIVESTNTAQNLIPLLADNNSYTGGTIEEAPLFPGCERGDEIATRQCFNKKMQEHIARNFRYPESAAIKGIQGRVSIMFYIDKTGSISNIKHRGPHKSLIEEAKRIITLLPQFEPAMHNGRVVRIPFSIPITFKLQ